MQIEVGWILYSELVKVTNSRVRRFPVLYRNCKWLRSFPYTTSSKLCAHPYTIYSSLHFLFIRMVGGTSQF